MKWIIEINDMDWVIELWFMNDERKCISERLEEDHVRIYQV